MAGDEKSNSKLLWTLVGLLVAFWVVVGLIFGPSYFRRLGAFWYVDDCKDKGGCWNAKEGRCEMDPSRCATPPGRTGSGTPAPAQPSDTAGAPVGSP